jgi:hypothetical protein
VVQGGLRIAERTEALGCRVLQQRPTLGLIDFAPLIWRSLKM